MCSSYGTLDLFLFAVLFVCLLLFVVVWDCLCLRLFAVLFAVLVFGFLKLFFMFFGALSVLLDRSKI